MPRSRRVTRALVLGGLAPALLVSGAIAASAASPGASDLPDLTPLLPTGGAEANARWVDTRAMPGRVLYRFDTVIMNRGTGSFEVYRADDGTTYQRVWQGGDPGGAGTPKSFPSSGVGHTDYTIAQGAAGQANALRFSPAYGHNHFHSQRIAAYQLLSADGQTVREASKNLAGFCLYDSWGPPAAPYTDPYPGDYGDGHTRPCAYGESGYTGLLRMGIAPRWGDFYGSQLWDQWVDVTDVAPGTYRLRATVDPDGLYRESDEGDNSIVSDPITIPGVVAAPASATTRPGVPVSVPLAATVVGAGVPSRRSDCPDDQTYRASCMQTADPSAVTLAVAAPPTATGSVELRGTTASYTPAPGFTGTVTFSFTGTDSRGLRSAPATVTVTVAAPGAPAGGGAGSGSGAGAGTGSGTGAGSGPAHFTLSAAQLLINQRIGQAAIRRLNRVQAKLDGRAAPPTASGHGHGTVTLSARQLLINQRIYQAAIRRAAALEARLAGRTAPAAGHRSGGTVRLSLHQLVINQRIAQAAVRRANALVARTG